LFAQRLELKFQIEKRDVHGANLAETRPGYKKRLLNIWGRAVSKVGVRGLCRVAQQEFLGSLFGGLLSVPVRGPISLPRKSPAGAGNYPMTWLEVFEFSFYGVETFALPFAILVFAVERRKQRQIDEEELYQRLSDEYTNFLKLVLDNADLQLVRRHVSPGTLSEEQMERKFVLFGILVSLFERSYILVYDEKMSKQTSRLWSSWEDYMREWCCREDFRSALDELLAGEDPDFQKHIRRIASAVAVDSERNRQAERRVHPGNSS